MALLRPWIGERYPGGGRLGVVDIGPEGARLEFGGRFVHLDSTALTVGTKLQGVVKELPAKLPVVDYPVRPQMYSEAIRDLVADIEDLLPLLAGTLGDFARVGIVAGCRLKADDLPPGIGSYVKHLGRPWPGVTPMIESTVMVNLSTEADKIDRCHHSVNLNEDDRPGDVRVKLDWQRVMRPPQPAGADEIVAEVGACVAAATEYFNTFAAGDLDYGNE